MEGEEETGSNTVRSSSSTRRGTLITNNNNDADADADDEVQSHNKEIDLNVIAAEMRQLSRVQNIPPDRMVWQTIKVLNEKIGPCDEEEIMKLIEIGFNQSRSSFNLKFNLQRLIKEKDIEVTPESTYVLFGYEDRIKMEQFEDQMAKKKIKYFGTDQ